ncbi:extracellular catalytic domain type 1 short-chain-length polyhydroxyalkanoate depolymerase [Catenuloplanes japonicus]|uniref:extracellular catalytic domain type 1 short-chain-length polyhydroxyalkanoate depolymerase n=1 Tax=Catenuloplanes japonicus TaxID=33876 RepID=UPI0018DB5D44|nr:PHB depolymerase family esterase [Catenuloplanes japonicus]
MLLVAGCGGPAATSTTTEHTIGDRTYRLYRPASLPDGPAPLVVMLHGGAGSGRQAQETYGWDSLADREGVIVAYPDGLNRAWHVSDHCCGPPARDGVDDVAFITALVADVPGVDSSRVFATGISNGGMLAYRLACDTHGVFAAIGPVAGTQVGDCPAPDPISVLHIHGDADRSVPYDGGRSKRDSEWVRIEGPPIPALHARWQAVDACAAPSVAVTGVVTRSRAACASGRRVEMITVAGAGHQWPGSAAKPAAERLLDLDPPSDALDATAELWAFFSST